MTPRWSLRSRAGGTRRRTTLLDVLVDELGNALIDESGRGLEAAYPTTSRGLRDERGHLLVDETGAVLMAL